MEVEFTEYSRYGISYAPYTELAQDKANRSFGPWHDLENKVILKNQRSQTLEMLENLSKCCKCSYNKNQISSVKNV